MEPPPDSPPPVFTPVRLRYRRDGWTPQRQLAFIALLWETRCIVEACRCVGKSPEAAYKLFRRPDAASFRAAWLAAFERPRPRRPSTSKRPAEVSPLSTSQSSTFAGKGEPAEASPTPIEPRPPYSFEAFVRAARAARRRQREGTQPLRRPEVFRPKGS